MKIEILGAGCPKCIKLAEYVKTAVDELGIEAEVEKVTDIVEIAKHKVLMTPALVVDGEVKVAGKVPDVDEIKAMLV